MTDASKPTLSAQDKDRARRFLASGCWTDGLFDRNWAARMEREGWLEYNNASFYERIYTPTEMLLRELSQPVDVQAEYVAATEELERRKR